jgi:cytochrome c
MKNIFLIGIVLLTLTSCKKEEKQIIEKSTTSDLFDKDTTTVAYPLAKKGAEIFHGRGNCATCHQKEEKIIGPSISEIVAIYKKNNANMVAFLKEESEPILDPSKYAIMKANLEVTKGMSQEELQAISDYMYSVAK